VAVNFIQFYLGGSYLVLEVKFYNPVYKICKKPS
jgi:hypothetical protein